MSGPAPNGAPNGAPAPTKLGRRRGGRVLYLRVDPAGPGRAAITAPLQAAPAIKAAIPAAARDWDPDRRRWLIDADWADQLRDLLGPDFHVRYTARESIHTLPVLQDLRRTP